MVTERRWWTMLVLLIITGAYVVTTTQPMTTTKVPTSPTTTKVPTSPMTMRVPTLPTSMKALTAPTTMKVPTSPTEPTRKKCSVVDIKVWDADNTTSKFKYAVEAENPELCGSQKAFIKSCLDGRPEQQLCNLKVGEGQCSMRHRGSWKLDLPGHVTSGCFSAPGRDVSPVLALYFNLHEVNITFAKPSDPRINSWKLRIYKVILRDLVCFYMYCI
nr:uncharacterized protein LOC128689988 [Cherax quadricarinatus]